MSEVIDIRILIENITSLEAFHLESMYIRGAGGTRNNPNDTNILNVSYSCSFEEKFIDRRTEFVSRKVGLKKRKKYYKKLTPEELREAKSRGGKNGSVKDKSRAGKIGGSKIGGKIGGKLGDRTKKSLGGQKGGRTTAERYTKIRDDERIRLDRKVKSLNSSICQYNKLERWDMVEAKKSELEAVKLQIAENEARLNMR